MTDKPPIYVYQLTLRPLPGNPDPVRLLRLLLKDALRRYQFRCEDCRFVPKMGDPKC